MTGYVAAYSGQYIPTGGLLAGRIAYSTDTPQLRRANAAQGKLSAVDLQALDITYLYASEPWLTDLHRAALAEKLARGSMRRVWRRSDAGSPDSCRAFVAIVKSLPTGFVAVSFVEEAKIALPHEPLRLEIPDLSNASKTANRSLGPDGRLQVTVLIVQQRARSGQRGERRRLLGAAECRRGRRSQDSASCLRRHSYDCSEQRQGAR